MPELSPSQQSDTQVKGSHALLMSKMLSPKDRLPISWSLAVEYIQGESFNLGWGAHKLGSK